MSEALEKLLAQEPIREPAKRWRNWWREKKSYVCSDGVVYQEGEIHPGGMSWPSKEVAEEKASEWFAKHSKVRPHEYSEYLGAFPEGERP